MNNIAFFEIQSSNPLRDCKFYNSIFGWKFTKELNLPIELYRIETENILGAIIKRPAEIPPLECGTNAFTCSIQVIDFDKSANDILEAGGKIALDKFAIPGRCWQGYFLDLDNNVFGIFQIDDNAK